MARLDTTAIWFQRGEDETAMAEMPTTERERRLPTVAWVAGGVLVTALIFVAVILQFTHRARHRANLTQRPALTVPQTTLPTEPAKPAAKTSAVAATKPATVTGPAPARATTTPSTSGTPSPARHATERRVVPELVTAETLLHHGRPAAALAQFQRVLGPDPNDVRALRGACLSLSRLGRLDDAARVCRRALERAPGDLEARRALATIYFNGGAYKWSAAEWRRVVEQAPHDAHARSALHAAAARAGKKS